MTPARGGPRQFVPRPARMCDFHKTGTCMAGDLCRFAHEAVDKNGRFARVCKESFKRGLGPNTNPLSNGVYGVDS